jgi:hypothetical protein
MIQETSAADDFPAGRTAGSEGDADRRAHLDAIVSEAQEILSSALRSAPPS